MALAHLTVLQISVSLYLGTYHIIPHRVTFISQVKHNGKRIDAVAQTSKQGWVYLFDRVTGKPLFPIEVLKYPASTVPGEVTAMFVTVPAA